MIVPMRMFSGDEQLLTDVDPLFHSGGRADAHRRTVGTADRAGARALIGWLPKAGGGGGAGLPAVRVDLGFQPATVIAIGSIMYPAMVAAGL